MAIKRTTLVSAVVAIVMVAIVGTVAAAMYEGIQAGRKGRPGSSSTQGHVAVFPAIAPADSSSAPAHVVGTASTSASIAYPYPGGGGPFQPGPGPFGQGGVAGDGLSSWGVAFKETSDANAQPDAALVKSAYQDAQKKAQNLASATGLQLGKLLAISDFGQNEPYFDKASCIQPELPNPAGAVPAPGAPSRTTPGSSGASGSAPSGSGASNSGTATGTAIAAPPVPVPGTCVQKHYVVSWVLLRYQIG
jgi:hypothetical protein